MEERVGRILKDGHGPVTGLRRQLAKDQVARQVTEAIDFVIKPFAGDFSDMLSTLSHVLVPGDTPLSDTVLHPEAWEKEHARSCSCMDHCRAFEAVGGWSSASYRRKKAKTCMFPRLAQAIRCGIKLVPGPKREKHIGLTTGKPNAPSYNAFAATHDQAYKDLIPARVVEEASLDPGHPQRVEAVASNLTVIRRSDMMRAFLASGVEVKDEASLGKYEVWRQATIAANRRKGVPEKEDPPAFKTRVACNLTGCGTNDWSGDAPMISTSITDALALMTKGCYFVAADLKSAFYHYRMSEDSRRLLGTRLSDGTLVRFRSLPFGLRLAPAWACTFIACVTDMLKERGVRCVAYIDDILVVADTEKQMREHHAIMVSVLKDLGLAVNDSKLQMGQVVEYLGVQLDGRTCSVSACPKKAAFTLMDLKWARSHLKQLRSVSHVHEQWRSLLGKLQFLAGLEQAGRCHMQSMWDALTSRRKVSVAQLEKDLDWWEAKLQHWIDNENVAPSAVLITRQTTMKDAVYLTSDAGDHGFGYVWRAGGRGPQYDYYASTWEHLPTVPESSTEKEMHAVLHFMQSNAEALRGKVLACMTDSSCLASNLLSGASHGKHRHMLVKIMEAADELGCRLLAYWVHREDNAYCDYLASLAHTLSLPSLCGRVRLPQVRRGRGEESGGRAAERGARSEPAAAGSAGRGHGLRGGRASAGLRDPGDHRTGRSGDSRVRGVARGLVGEPVPGVSGKAGVVPERAVHDGTGRGQDPRRGVLLKGAHDSQGRGAKARASVVDGGGGGQGAKGSVDAVGGHAGNGGVPGGAHGRAHHAGPGEERQRDAATAQGASESASGYRHLVANEVRRAPAADVGPGDHKRGLGLVLPPLHQDGQKRHHSGILSAGGAGRRVPSGSDEALAKGVVNSVRAPTGLRSHRGSKAGYDGVPELQRRRAEGQVELVHDQSADDRVTAAAAEGAAGRGPDESRAVQRSQHAARRSDHHGESGAVAGHHQEGGSLEVRHRKQVHGDVRPRAGSPGVQQRAGWSKGAGVSGRGESRDRTHGDASRRAHAASEQQRTAAEKAEAELLISDGWVRQCRSSRRRSTAPGGRERGG